MRSLLVAVTALLAVTGAGCAGMGGSTNKSTGPPPLSRAKFAHAANRACVREHQIDKRIPSPTSYTTFLHGLKRAIRADEQEIIALRELTPPRGDTALFNRALRILDAQDFAAHDLIDAVQDHQAARAQRLAKKLDAFGKRIRRLDRRLGLPACVKAAS